MIYSYRGKNVDHVSRDELVAAVKELGCAFERLLDGARFGRELRDAAKSKGFQAFRGDAGAPTQKIL